MMVSDLQFLPRPAPQPNQETPCCPLYDLYAHPAFVELEQATAPDGKAFNEQIERGFLTARKLIADLKEKGRWSEAVLPEKTAHCAKPNIHP